MSTRDDGLKTALLDGVIEVQADLLSDSNREAVANFTRHIYDNAAKPINAATVSALGIGRVQGWSMISIRGTSSTLDAIT